MILPKNLKRAPAPQQKDPASIKLFLLALSDLHTNRFKNGWFTLLKFTEQVKQKPHLMDEMRKFSETKLEKPVVEVYHNVTTTAAAVV